jgi:hypothetical protein
MPEIQHSEPERENGGGTQAVSGGGHGDLPVDDPPPAEHPEERPGEPGETEDEVQARESETAFERAIARLPAG